MISEQFLSSNKSELTFFFLKSRLSAAVYLQPSTGQVHWVIMGQSLAVSALLPELLTWPGRFLA